MSKKDSDSVMRRKAGLGRPPPEIGRLTPATLLRAAVARAADETAGLTVHASALEEARVTLSGFDEMLPEHPLLALLEDKDGGFAMLVLDGQVLAALVEIQTTGRVVPAAAAPRGPTRTDAILAAGFIDALLAEFETRTAEAGLAVAPAVSGYRYALPLADSRAMLMTLEDQPYRCYTLTLDLGQGAKEGRLWLLYPHAPPRRAGRVKNSAGWHNALGKVVGNADVCMEAVLARKEMTLAEVTGLQVGAQIVLPREALDRIVLEDSAGAQVSLGRLGMQGGFRALCIRPETAEAQAADALLFPGDGDTAPLATPAGTLPMRSGAAMPLALPGTDVQAAGSDEAALPDLPDLPELSGLADAPMGVSDLPEMVD